MDNTESDSSTGPASTPGDGPDFPNDLPAVHNINGLWEDSGRPTRITQTGKDVTALYVEPHICDHADGTGQTSETDLDFNATLDGDTLTGEISACRYGFDDGSNGFAPAYVQLIVSPDDMALSGFWHDNVGDTDVPLTITRLGCLEKSAEDYGLPSGNYVSSEYNANRVHRRDGSVQTVADDYVLNPPTDLFVRPHRGIDYSSNDSNGNQTNVDFTAGVSGTVDVLEGSDWNTINVTTANGNVVQYLHASNILVSDGQTVGPDTVLGQTGNAGLGPSGAIHLHVQAKDASGNYINPNCAEER